MVAPFKEERNELDVFIIQLTSLAISAGTPSSSAVDRVGAVRRWEQNVTGVTLATQCARLVTAAAQQWLTSRADRLPRRAGR